MVVKKKTKKTKKATPSPTSLSPSQAGAAAFLDAFEREEIKKVAEIHERRKAFEERIKAQAENNYLSLLAKADRHGRSMGNSTLADYGKRK